MKIFFVLLIAVTAKLTLGARLEDDVSKFSHEISRKIRSGRSSDLLDALIRKLALPEKWYLQPRLAIDDVSPQASCTICKSMAKSILELRREGVSSEVIIDTVIDLCNRLHLHSENYCRGSINLNAPIFLWIADNDPTVTGDDYCALALQNSRCATIPAKFDWIVDVDKHAPKIYHVQPSDEQLKIVHISDIHYDPRYEVGGNAQCGEPNCCRRGQGPSAPGITPAGYWGDYRVCDTPWHAVVDALDHIKEQHQDADFIYYTGDIVDHGEWETTREGNKDIIVKVYAEINKTLGNKPVYPIIGNHEANPLNIFASPNVDNDEVSTKWLYELLADIWIGYGWLPENTRETILRGGFYTVLPKKGFRIIALNNNVAYTYNWWLIYEPNDLGGQLKWLADTLLEAEKNNEIVHILAHVPSGAADQQNTWSREFRKIVNRFAHIIAGQFNGHTHADEINVFFDTKDFAKVINVAWNGGSVTPWAYVNPNYRVYWANKNTYEVEESHNWMYNLTEANMTPEKRPTWIRSYSFKEEYGLEDLSKKSLRSLVFELVKGGPKAAAYHKHFSKDATPWNQWNCDKACALKQICTIVTTINNDDTECNYITKFT